MLRNAWRASLVVATLALSLDVAYSAPADPTVDPHGRQAMCHHCHVETYPEEGDALLRYPTARATCVSCHEETIPEEHLLRVLPDAPVKRQIIIYFSQRSSFSCTTCHHVTCRSSSRNALRLRYPHMQLDERGKIIEEACLFCHEVVPDSEQPDADDVVMRYSTSYLCSLCHAMSTLKTGMGFGEPMSAQKLQRKERFERIYDIVLPLGPGNKVTCASCHNPHQYGVFLRNNAYSQPTGSRRLLTHEPWQLCEACHEGKLDRGE